MTSPTGVASFSSSASGRTSAFTEPPLRVIRAGIPARIALLLAALIACGL